MRSGRVFSSVPRILASVAVAISIALVAASTGGGTAQAQLAGLCESADKLRTEKNFRQANRLYALALAMSLAGQQSPSQCAVVGLVQVFSERSQARATLERAEGAEKGGSTAEALALYKQAAAQDPELSAASAAVKRLQASKPKTEFGAVEWLKDQTKAGRVKFKNLFDDVKDAGRYILVSLATVLATIVVISVIYRLLRRWLFAWSLDIQDFDKGATGLDLGKSLSALVEERYRWHKAISETEGAAARSQMLRPELVTEPPGQIDLPQTEVPQFKVIVGILNWLLPPRRARSVNGFMQHSDRRGAGLTLSLFDARKRVLQTVTVWESDFAPPQAKYDEAGAQSFYALADPAAIWLQFVTARRRSAVLRRQTDVLPVFGTQVWSSYALQQAGIQALQQGSAGGAYLLFKRSADQDPLNFGVAANLAASASQGEAEWALRVLRHALTKVDKLAESYLDFEFGPPKTNLAMWYSLLYQEAATLDYLGYNYGARSNAARLQAQIDAKLRDLDGKIDEYQLTRRSRSTRLSLAFAEHVLHDSMARRQRSELRSLDRLETLQTRLQQMWPMVKAMRASILINRPSVPASDQALARELLPDEPPENLRLRVQYNLACFEATIARHKAGTERQQALRRAMEHLTTALDSGLDLVAAAQRDPSLSPLREVLADEFKAAIAAASGRTPAPDPGWT